MRFAGAAGAANREDGESRAGFSVVGRRFEQSIDRARGEPILRPGDERADA